MGGNGSPEPRRFEPLQVLQWAGYRVLSSVMQDPERLYCNVGYLGLSFRQRHREHRGG